MHKVMQSRFNSKKDKSFDSLADAAKEAFLALDEQWLHMAQKRGLGDGSTAVVCVVRGCTRRPVQLLLANLGDSRAVLCRGGEAVRITRDHKPELKDEKARVEKVGGMVVKAGGCWRVTHTSHRKDQAHHLLAVSRTLGMPTAS